MKLFISGHSVQFPGGKTPPRIPPRIHFIGIGGIGMSALAGICLEYGYHISGSDLHENENVRKLRMAGAHISLGHRAGNADDCDIAVFSSAVRRDNPEVVRAAERGICLLERHKLLGILFNGFETGVAVSGCHGKTTVCGMLTHILLQAGRDPQVLVGGNLGIIGGNYRKGRDCVVAEACEYKRNFLSLHPLIPVVLSTEPDHMDYFKDGADVASAYHALLHNMKAGGTAVLCGDDFWCRKFKDIDAVTFGMGAHCDFRAEHLCGERGRYRFDSVSPGKRIPIRLSVPGRHNVHNALAAVAVANLLGVSDEDVQKGLYAYTGIRRRFEITGTCGAAEVVLDYAHHPKELAAVLSAAREAYSGNILAVFQPHTYSRTRAMLTQFADVLAAAKNVLLLPVYAARELPDPAGDSGVLHRVIAERHPDTRLHLAEDFDEAARYIGLHAQNIDAVLLLGAGDIDALAGML